MDQIKIGKFISERRKLLKLTQSQLAEKLNITDKAVSKWETGRSMPDSSVMLELCRILEISVNDLLSGEVVSMENYNKEMEKNLLEAIKQKEKADKRLLNLEIFIGFLGGAALLASVMVASFAEISEWLRITLIAGGFVVFIPIIVYCVRIEQVAGYYECQKCKYRYVPKFSSVLNAPHVNRTRYMRCPKCNEKSWQKKVLSKDRQ